MTERAIVSVLYPEPSGEDFTQEPTGEPSSGGGPGGQFESDASGGGGGGRSVEYFGVIEYEPSTITVNDEVSWTLYAAVSAIAGAIDYGNNQAGPATQFIHSETVYFTGGAPPDKLTYPVTQVLSAAGSYSTQHGSGIVACNATGRGGVRWGHDEGVGQAVVRYSSFRSQFTTGPHTAGGHVMELTAHNRVIATAGFAVLPAGSEGGDSTGGDTVLTLRSVEDDSVIAGASVWVDGALIGETDASGQINVGALGSGAHSLRMTHPDYIASDQDDLDNDQFTL